MRSSEGAAVVVFVVEETDADVVAKWQEIPAAGETARHCC